MDGIRGVYNMTDAEKVANVLNAFEMLKEIEKNVRQLMKNQKISFTPDALTFATICGIIAETEVPDITIVTDLPINDNEIIGIT